MTMQMQIKAAIESMTVTKKQADELVLRKKMVIIDRYCITINGGGAVLPTYYIRG